VINAPLAGLNGKENRIMEFRVRHGLQPHRIQGALLAEVTTERPFKDRWMEMALYRADPGGLVRLDEHGMADGEPQLPGGGYVTYVIGQSIRTHGRGSACGEGVPWKVCDLPLDAQPCGRCAPDFPHVRPGLTGLRLSQAERRVEQARQGMTQMVDLEVTRHTLYPVATAQEVYDGITRRGMSDPAERCLRIAAIEDGEIAAILARLDAMAGGVA
jgi:hypothetical protein